MIALFAGAAVVGALGLDLLFGQAGQLSLGHSAFVAVGAFGYTVLAAEPDGDDMLAFGFPPLLAMVLAVALAGCTGLLFSPISGRLKGVYLGIATLALVFLAQHAMSVAPTVTGGVNGRSVPEMSIFGLPLDDSLSDRNILGLALGRSELLWAFTIAVGLGAYVAYRNIVRSRSGRALQGIRVNELAATVVGVDVMRHKAVAFGISSAYAGLAGVLFALAYGYIVPEAFALLMAIDFVVMVILGGLGSAGGVVVAATLVTALPALLERYSDYLPFVAPVGSAGLTGSNLARISYGVILAFVLLVEPRGLSALYRRFVRFSRNGTGSRWSSLRARGKAVQPTEAVSG
jgi:branched-chain amino acid transport system permease protein